MIETKFLDNLPHITIAQSADNNPLKRNATVEDIVPIIQFLLSEKADYITGQNIVVSGGSVIG
jgi:3-oxoacyl-[acyl-carrier protein] reductase